MLPYPDDPDYPTAVAARALLWLGLWHLVPIGIVLCSRGPSGADLALSILICGIPFCGYASLSAGVQARSFWGLIIAVVVCSIELVIALILTFLLVRSLGFPYDDMGIFLVLFVVMVDCPLIATLWLLSACFRSLREEQGVRATGFEPIMGPTPAIPVANRESQKE